MKDNDLIFYFNDNNKLVYWNLLLYITISFTFLYFGYFIEKTLSIKLVLFIIVSFFYISSFINYLRFLRVKISNKNVALKFDDIGIIDNILTNDTIRWEELDSVKFATTTKENTNGYLLLFFYNEEERIKKLFFFKIIFIKINKKLFGTHFAIQLNSKKNNIQDVLTFCLMNISKKNLDRQITRNISNN